MIKTRLSALVLILCTVQFGWADAAKHFQILSTTNVHGEIDPCG